MESRFLLLLTPLMLGSFLCLPACSAPSAESVGAAAGADTASCATTELDVAAGLIDDLRGAMAEGAAPDPSSVEIPGGLTVSLSGKSAETVSTVIGVGSTMVAGPEALSAARLGVLPFDGPLGVESANAAKALYDAMKVDGVESQGMLVKRSGPLTCLRFDFDVPNASRYSCTVGNLTEVAHGFDGTGTTLTMQPGTIAAIRDALEPEDVTADGFAVAGSLSGTIQPGGGPDHVTSVDGIETFATPVETTTMTAHLGGFDFSGEDKIVPGNAAAKVFSAMTRATETVVPSQHLTIRKSANGRIVCTRNVEKLDLYACSITGVVWQTIAEGSAAIPGFCAAP